MEYLLMKKFLFAALSLLTASLSLAAVNINTASPSELEALPGIGPAYSDRKSVV